MNTCKTPNEILYVSYIIGIIINIIIIYALNDIEKKIECKCSNNSKKQFLKEWFIFVIVLQIILLLIFIMSNYECLDVFRDEYFNNIFGFMIGIVEIVMLVRLFIYIRWLRNDCKCAYGNEERIIYWYLIILFIIFFSIILFTFFLLLIILIKYNLYI
jgi:hypothetical protein